MTNNPVQEEATPFKNFDRFLTYQEMQLLGGSEERPSGSVYAPLGLVNGTAKREEILSERGQLRYVENLLVLGVWMKNRGLQGVVRVILSPVDPETFETKEDFRVLVGRVDGETGKFVNATDHTRDCVSFLEEEYNKNFEMREGKNDPEGRSGRHPER